MKHLFEEPYHPPNMNGVEEVLKIEFKEICFAQMVLAISDNAPILCKPMDADTRTYTA